MINNEGSNRNVIVCEPAGISSIVYAPVTLVWMQGGVRVSRAGIAMNGAAKGDWVQVRVDGRADRFVGQATGEGEVRLPGGMR